MSSMAPNVSSAGAPGRRIVYSMCGMCAVRCPMEVTVEDGRVTWVQGNPHDEAIGASLCAKGSAGLALEYDDDQRPQTPLIRMGPRGGGQWRRTSWDEALDYIADKLKETIEAFGGRGIVLSDRGGPFTDLTRPSCRRSARRTTSTTTPPATATRTTPGARSTASPPTRSSPT